MILIVRYSRFWPSTSRCSFFTTVPAPWCGYTTLSPTLYKSRLPRIAGFFHEGAGGSQGAAGKSGQYNEFRRKRPAFQVFLRETPGNADLDREVTVDEVVLLEAAEPLADLAGANRADALHP